MVGRVVRSAISSSLMRLFACSNWANLATSSSRDVSCWGVFICFSCSYFVPRPTTSEHALALVWRWCQFSKEAKQSTTKTALFLHWTATRCRERCCKIGSRGQQTQRNGVAIATKDRIGTNVAQHCFPFTL